MSEVKIQYDQRILGRFEGDEETVELTPFVQNLLDQGRVHIVADDEQKEPAPEPEPEPQVQAPVLNEAVEQE